VNRQKFFLLTSHKTKLKELQEKLIREKKKEETATALTKFLSVCFSFTNTFPVSVSVVLLSDDVIYMYSQ